GVYNCLYFLLQLAMDPIEIEKQAELDRRYAEAAIKLAEQSLLAGAFPAGAIVVIDGDIVASAISNSYPAANHHAESKAIDAAMEKLNRQLADATLYASMESCLMCLSNAYWSGIRRVVFAAAKASTNHR